MAEYRLTKLAVRDIEDIWDYTFETWSEQQADYYYGQLVDGFEYLVSNPRIGRQYEGVSKDLLGLKVNRHVIFYRVISTDLVEITRILHDSMDLKRHLD